MTTRTTTPVEVAAAMRLTPPWTAEERLADIERMSRQVTAHVQFMLGVKDLKGMSAESKDKAIAALHARLAALESQLGRIKEDLLLG
jgi:hypothetical protein